MNVRGTQNTGVATAWRCVFSSLKNDTTNVSQVVGGMTRRLAIAVATWLLVSSLVKRPKPQSEEEETPKRFLPEPLLDEIEVEYPITFSSVALCSIAWN
jgi:hypothetical protein